MKKFKYSETGNFTNRQRKLCEDISKKIEQLQKSGCSVIAKQNRLEVYLSKEIQYSNIINPGEPYNNSNVIPLLTAGWIDDSGADDTECFIDSVLKPEDD